MQCSCGALDEIREALERIASEGVGILSWRIWTDRSLYYVRREGKYVEIPCPNICDLPAAILELRDKIDPPQPKCCRCDVQLITETCPLVVNCHVCENEFCPKCARSEDGGIICYICKPKEREPRVGDVVCFAPIREDNHLYEQGRPEIITAVVSGDRFCTRLRPNISGSGHNPKQWRNLTIEAEQAGEK